MKAGRPDTRTSVRPRRDPAGGVGIDRMGLDVVADGIDADENDSTEKREDTEKDDSPIRSEIEENLQ